MIKKIRRFFARYKVVDKHQIRIFIVFDSHNRNEVVKGFFYFDSNKDEMKLEAETYCDRLNGIY